MIRISSRKNKLKISKNIFSHSLKNKKGIQFALESLVGVVLSVIALMFIVSLFSKVFLQTPTNEKIVDFNAKSIVSFVDFSSEKYKNEENCYTMLKLENLENYQFAKDGRNYFYVIGEKGSDLGVYTIKLEYLKNVYETKSLDGIPARFYKFKVDDVKIKLDKTKDTGITVGFEFWSFGGVSSGIELNEDVRFILLVPDFDVKIGMFTIDFLNSNQNILRGKVYSSSNNYEPEGYHLSFKPNSGELFLSKSKYSNSLIAYKSCFSKEISQGLIEQVILKDPQLADFVNNKLVFDYVDSKTNLEQDFKFVWSVNGIECPISEGKSCKDYLGENFEKLNYDDFRYKVREIHNKKFEAVAGKGSSKLVKIIELTYEEVMKGNLNNIEPYDYNSLFIEYDIGNLNRDNAEQVMFVEFSDYAFKGFNNDDNCISEYCDYAGFKNGNIYYYDLDHEDFVLFNINLIRKYNKDYYYMGKKINLKKGKYDDIGWSPFRDDFEFYSFDIQTELGMKSVFLSESQLNNIKRYIGEVEE